MTANATLGQAPENRAYWDAARKGRLLVKRCTACDRPHYYPRAICPYCHSDRTEWIESEGRGIIHSFTVLRRTDPVVVPAYVRLHEGVIMYTSIVDCDPDRLAIDQPVRVVFAASSDGRQIPMFEPIAEGSKG
jgi:uncharacterized protein